mgnify:CR=1 FL=1
MQRVTEKIKSQRTIRNPSFSLINLEHEDIPPILCEQAIRDGKSAKVLVPDIIMMNPIECIGRPLAKALSKLFFSKTVTSNPFLDKR